MVCGLRGLRCGVCCVDGVAMRCVYSLFGARGCLLLLFVVCCLLLFVVCWLFDVCCALACDVCLLLFVVCCSLLFVFCILRVVRCVVYCLLPGVCCALCVVCCMPVAAG